MGAQLEGEGSAQFPAERTLRLQKVQDLRYGENPHQAAAFYRRDGYVNAEHSLAHAKQHQGKELSYNNYLDLDAAWTAVREFDEPACVIVKHLTPCGVCQDDDLVAAYQRAHACDPVSAYGGVMAFNRPVTSDVVVAIFDNNEQFVEAIIAPEFAGDALDVLQRQEERAPAVPRAASNPAGGEVEYRSVEGGLLCQDSDAVAEDPAAFTVPTKRQPTDEEMAELLFAWKVCKSIKSNAIAITKGHATIGVGGGQPKRVELRAHRRGAGGRCCAGRRGRVRRVLPVPRRPGRARRSRRDRRHRAGRLQSRRRGGHRRRRRARHSARVPRGIGASATGKAPFSGGLPAVETLENGGRRPRGRPLDRCVREGASSRDGSRPPGCYFAFCQIQAVDAVGQVRRRVRRTASCPRCARNSARSRAR